MNAAGPRRRRPTPPPEPDPEYEVDYRALAELRHQIRRFLTFSEDEARSAGVEPQQHQLLLAVKGLPDGQRPTIGVLADRLLLRHHTVVGLVDRLVVAKLATRQSSDTDGREILVRITARGEKILGGLALAHSRELRTVGPALAQALDTILDGTKTRRPS